MNKKKYVYAGVVSSSKELLYRLVALEDEKDTLTFGFNKRMTKYTCAIGQIIEVEEKEKDKFNITYTKDFIDDEARISRYRLMNSDNLVEWRNQKEHNKILKDMKDKDKIENMTLKELKDKYKDVHQLVRFIEKYIYGL